MKFKKIDISFDVKVENDHRKAVLEYIENLTDKDLPPILSPDHFSLLTNVEANVLYEMTNAPNKYYRSFSLAKRNGGKRRIDAPLPSLHFIQRWILDNILSKVELNGAAKAYRKGYSIRDNARFHKAQPLLFKADVSNFFGSISEYKVVNIFKELGYSTNVSIFLSKLCCLNECLPQGAATSGCLSNIYLIDFDLALFQKCSEEKFRYTRYADDVAISGAEVDFETIKSFVKGELNKRQLKLNAKKTRLLKPHNRQCVTGIIVNDKLSVPREYIRALKQDCYFIEKYGIYGHSKAIKSKSPRGTLENVIGRLAHVSFVLPKEKKWKDLRKRMLEIRSENFNL